MLVSLTDYFSSFSTAWIFWDYIESVFHSRCKGISQVFTRCPVRESYRNSDRECGDSKSSAPRHSWKWWCNGRWQTIRIFCISWWPHCKKNTSFWILFSLFLFPSVLRSHLFCLIVGASSPSWQTITCPFRSHTNYIGKIPYIVTSSDSFFNIVPIFNFWHIGMQQFIIFSRMSESSDSGTG